MDARSRPLLLLLRGRLGLMELGRKLFINLLAEGLFDEFARIAARLTSKAFGRDRGIAAGTDDDFDSHATPPPVT